MRNYLPILLLIINATLVAQENLNEEQKLEEILVSTNRIELPFSKDSRTITIITAEEIKKSAAPTVADVLQQVAGVDVRRRGTFGTQADLYIRGGGFDQTLLLIDGIKVEDAQTGHHTLNLALPVEVIERIEIIKGPAARVYGQNAFTGAINIVTKKNAEEFVSLILRGGSYDQLHPEVTGNLNFENSTHLFHYSRNTSQGYRFNTDYDNQNIFLKSTLNTQVKPIEMLVAYNERNFGANGFYASPTFTDQYEETQTSLVGISTKFEGEKLTWSPRLYWRRNQDEFLLFRDEPLRFRNLHVTNKIGLEANASYTSSVGITGFGVDVSQTLLSSNNLGERNRFMATVFLEQRFQFMEDKLDITPGLAATYFSDFGFHTFPGIDIGYQFSNQWKVYANAGYTYRIPTYTDLFYSDPTTIGNENLEPEEALSQELGLKFSLAKFNFTTAFFNRDSKNLIDYVKNTEEDPFMATNIRSLNTRGFEVNADYRFTLAKFQQSINLGYNYIEDEVQELEVNFSRYSINSLQHQVIAGFKSQFFKNISQSIIYKFAERTSGDSYTVLDVQFNWQLKQLQLSVIGNNIFNERYTETNLVPMPLGNVLVGVTYKFE